MARISHDQPLVASMLDRLIDDNPGGGDGPRSETQVLRELKQSLRRDLENLLNTRQRAVSFPNDLEELEASLVNYGIPDVIGSGLAGGEARAEFLRTVEAIVRQFEPRFRRVEATLLQNADPLDRTLRFRINAELDADPAPEPVTFDSALQPVTGDVEVKGVR